MKTDLDTQGNISMDLQRSSRTYGSLDILNFHINDMETPSDRETKQQKTECMQRAGALSG